MSEPENPGGSAERSPSPSGGAGGSKPAGGTAVAERNIFAKIVLFVRQVIAELRKVVTPTRQELVTFTAVVIVFVLIVMAYVGVLDYMFGRLVFWAFGRDI